MTPVFYINIFGDFAFPVYVFGLSIVICFFLFLWMLKKLSVRFGFEYHFFTNSILWYFFSIFIFSRLFYVISMTSWLGVPYISTSLSTTPTGSFLPIALIYSGLSFILFSVLYILSMYINVRGLLWYIWLGIFSAITLILEYYSAKPDVFSLTYNISFSQMWAIIFICISFYGIYRVMNISWNSKNTILGDIS